MIPLWMDPGWSLAPKGLAGLRLFNLAQTANSWPYNRVLWLSSQAPIARVVVPKLPKVYCMYPVQGHALPLMQLALGLGGGIPGTTTSTTSTLQSSSEHGYPP